MRVFLFEFVTGGGWFLVDSTSPPDGSLQREGAAMLNAVADDFSRLPNVSLATLRDRRLLRDRVAGESTTVASAAEMWQGLQAQAAVADYVLVIAPEFEQFLEVVVGRVLEGGARVLNPTLPLIRLAADKQQMVNSLAKAGVPVPAGELLPPGSMWQPSDSTRVVKPNDGAGSLGVTRIDANTTEQDQDAANVVRRIEVFHPGMPVSVAVLLRGDEPILLPACKQLLSDDGYFTYFGGESPLEKTMNRRAHALAHHVAKVLPTSWGYMGIDMVLGESTDGSDDVVIEVNPRLTTSYVGLRHVVDTNLAAAMIGVAEGRKVTVKLSDRRVRFTADGKVTDLESNGGVVRH